MYKKMMSLSLLMSMAIMAHASIMIYPKFVFFDDKTRSEEVLLVNGEGIQSANYRISLTYKKQDMNGNYEEITDAAKVGEDSAVPFLRYSPRSVELPPSQSQVVRLLKRLPENLPAGDYVAYITFTEVPQEQPKKSNSGKAKGITVRVTPIPSFSVPILLRHKVQPEDIQATVQADKLHYEGNKTFLPVRLGRVKTDKNIQTFIRGDISVWVKDQVIGHVKGKYLLPGNDFVDVNVPLFVGENKWLDLKGKKLTILFTSFNEAKIDKTQILAQTEIQL